MKLEIGQGPEPECQVNALLDQVLAPVGHQELDLEPRVGCEEVREARDHLAGAEGDRQRDPQHTLEALGAAGGGGRLAELEQHPARPLEVGTTRLG